MNKIARDIDFYRSLWERLVGNPFTPEHLAARVHHDGGYDMENLSESELIELIKGRFQGRWSEPGFSFSELLAFYSVPGALEGPEQVVGWVFASFVVADAIRKEVLDWELQFNNFFNGLLVVRPRLESEELVHILQRMFGDEVDGSSDIANQQGR